MCDVEHGGGSLYLENNTEERGQLIFKQVCKHNSLLSQRPWHSSFRAHSVCPLQPEVQREADHFPPFDIWKPNHKKIHTCLSRSNIEIKSQTSQVHGNQAKSTGLGCCLSQTWRCWLRWYQIKYTNAWPLPDGRDLVKIWVTPSTRSSLQNVHYISSQNSQAPQNTIILSWVKKSGNASSHPKSFVR
jgi:hypothetical protein